MSVVAALRRPLGDDLSGFVLLLRQLEVPHRVSEESGEQVLWVPDERLAEDVRGLFQRYPRGNPQGNPQDNSQDNSQGNPAAGSQPAPPPLARDGFLVQLRRSPLTALVLLVTLLVAGLSGLGDNHVVLHWLTFQEYRVQGDYAYFTPWLDSLQTGQWWRLFSPMLIHFGWLHLVMNGLWYWELGRRVEARQGGLMLFGLTLLLSLLSNLAQFWFGGAGLFGGLSGVLYGLLGHCWLFQLLAPTPAYRLPPGVLGMMLIWLLVCLSGAVDLLGFGAIANAAHVGGLLAGCATGLLGGALARARR